ncbi:hypothetical protein COCNU_06G002570 [Cocos nucifera]|uniref:Uncharacterized protein n=1 Tax=Cocos nucifera TaxID=13894 RepID=A0A8K0I9X0_COCNU|nr:hypothetical protein COCNU_06G002570 [Cocos nucifera]
METISPTSSSVSGWREASTFDEFSMQQSLLFSDSLKDLKNLRSQLYSAAEYFELSYTDDDQKKLVVNTLKDYAVKALVNTVDHLGSVSFKVNGLLDEKVDEVSGTELRVSCIEQRIRACQALIDREGLSQQSLVITAPKYHKQYILPGKSLLLDYFCCSPIGGSLPESGRHAVAKSQESKIVKDDIELQHLQAVNGLLDEKVDEVSGTELRVSCIEQRIRACQALIDREGLSQQSLVITAPKYHKQYILPGKSLLLDYFCCSPIGGSLPESGRHAVAKSQESKIVKDDIELQHLQAGNASLMRHTL